MNIIKKFFSSILILHTSLIAQSTVGPYLWCPSTDPNSTVTIFFVHGLVDNETQAYNYFKQSFKGHCKNNNLFDRYVHDLDHESLVSVQFDDAGSGISKYFKARYSTLGQGNEIERIKQVYDACNLGEKDTIIFHGPSRGPAAIINFIAKYNPTNIGGLILESAFDSVQGGLQAKSLYKSKKRFCHWCMYTVFRYRRDGEHPIDQIKFIKNKNLPILIVCSEQDNIVHWRSSENLYNAFIKNGFTNVQFVKTKQGGHAKILWGPDGDQYVNAVRALKEKIQEIKLNNAEKEMSLQIEKYVKSKSKEYQKKFLESLAIEELERL